MSAPGHDGWPQVDSIWEHWADLLLATQLAALREGYTAISKFWEADRPDFLKFRCFVSATADRETCCQKFLIYARAEDQTKLDGRWIVDTHRLENLEVGQHKGHNTGVGLSQGFQSPPTKKPKLSIGRRIKDWSSMHKIEGCLRSSARFEGRYLRSFAQKFERGAGDDRTYSYFLSCVLGEHCDYYVRFSPDQQTDGAGWICQQLCLQHSCSSVAPGISKDLQKKLSFWPKLKITGNSTEVTARRKKKKGSEAVTGVDQHLGHHPVLAPGQTAPHRVVPLPISAPATAPVKPVDPKQAGSVAKAQIPPSKDRQTLQTLNTRLHLAQTMDDLKEVRSLKIQIKEMEKGGLEENETKEAETESNKRQRAIDLSESLEGKATVKKKSKSNLPSKPSSNLRLPLPPLNSNTPILSTSAGTTQVDELKQRQDSLVKAIDSLFSTRRLILDLEQKLTLASALDDHDEAKKLEAGIQEFEKRRNEIEKKVTRRKNKVRRTKLRIQYERILDKTVTSKSDPPGLKKQKKGKTAGKEKKNKGK